MTEFKTIQSPGPNLTSADTELSDTSAIHAPSGVAWHADARLSSPGTTAAQLLLSRYRGRSGRGYMQMTCWADQTTGGRYKLCR